MYNIPIRTPGLEPAARFTAAHAPSHSEKRSVVMALEDYSHGDHRAVLPTTFTKERMKTLRDPAKLLSCLADRNRRTRTFDTLDISQLLYPLSYVPSSELYKIICYRTECPMFCSQCNAISNYTVPIFIIGGEMKD